MNYRTGPNNSSVTVTFFVFRVIRLLANFLTTHVVRFTAISLVSAGLAGCWGEDELSLDHEKIAWVHKISIPDWSRDRTAERISSPIITIPAGDLFRFETCRTDLIG